MRRVILGAGLFVLVGCVALAGCSGTVVTAPTPTPQPANLSGDYTGTMQDAQGGNGTATATLAQTGYTVGGAITDTMTSSTVTAQISLNLTSSDAVSGAMVVDYASGTTCTFSTTGSYDPNTNVLSGSYTAVTNCSGDTGTYSLTQQCTDTIANGERRRMVGGIGAC